MSSMRDNTSDEFLTFYIANHPAPQPIVKESSKPKNNYPRNTVCEFCNKALPKRFKVHKNVCQEPSEHKFCSRECKENVKNKIKEKY